MSLVTTKDLMLDAQKNHYAIGAFNAENMEMVQAIIAAAEELRAPVIVQTTPGTLKYASPAMFHAMVAAAASEASVPVVMPSTTAAAMSWPCRHSVPATPPS